jgi:alkanesulfonate monooxygenase
LQRRPRRNARPLRFGTAGFVIARPSQAEADEEHEYLAQLAAHQDYTKLMKGIDPDVAMFKTFAKVRAGWARTEELRWGWSTITALWHNE